MENLSNSQRNWTLETNGGQPTWLVEDGSSIFFKNVSWRVGYCLMDALFKEESVLLGTFTSTWISAAKSPAKFGRMDRV